MKPLGEILPAYNWRKKTLSITVHEKVRIGLFRTMDVKCDVDSAYAMGENAGYCKAVEDIYGLDSK